MRNNKRRKINETQIKRKERDHRITFINYNHSVTLEVRYKRVT